jgi:hypothetical protein
VISKYSICLLPLSAMGTSSHHGGTGQTILQRGAPGGWLGASLHPGQHSGPPRDLSLSLASSHGGDRNWGERTFTDRNIKNEVMEQIEKLNCNKLLRPDGIHLRAVEKRRPK